MHGGKGEESERESPKVMEGKRVGAGKEADLGETFGWGEEGRSGINERGATDKGTAG